MHGYSESGLVHTAMKDGSLAAAIYHMTDHQLSSSIILALMELCVAKNSSNYSGTCHCVCFMIEREGGIKKGEGERERDREREREREREGERESIP